MVLASKKNFGALRIDLDLKIWKNGSLNLAGFPDSDELGDKNCNQIHFTHNILHTYNAIENINHTFVPGGY